MPTRRSPKLNTESLPSAVRQWCEQPATAGPLPDEVNSELFQRLELLELFKWMRKHKHRVPVSFEEAQRLASEYILYGRKVSYLQLFRAAGEREK